MVHRIDQSEAEKLSAGLAEPPGGPTSVDVSKLLFDSEEPPPFPPDNIFPLTWETETPRLLELYEKSRDPGWSPERLPWNSLHVADFTLDQRYALSYWFALLSVFDSSGPAVFARAMIHTYETHEEDPIRKCFFSVTRDEVHHEEICQRAITLLTPGGPFGYVPETPLGKLAQNGARWYHYNGARYWEGFRNGMHKHPLPILFTSFLMGEMASSTLFHDMYRATTIPVFKEAFRRVGQDEARHMGICLTVLGKLLPKLTDEQRAAITRQIRAGYVFLSGILYEPPDQFWQLPASWRPAHKLLEGVARGAGLGILSDEARRENWRTAFLKLKGLLEPYAIVFPAIPEIGIDGATTAFSADDIVPVF
jgi:rubrerythrin